MMDIKKFSEDLVTISEEEFCYKYKLLSNDPKPAEVFTVLKQQDKLELLIDHPPMTRNSIPWFTLLLVKGDKYETCFFIRERFCVEKCFDTFQEAAFDKISRMLDSLGASRR